MVVIADGLVKRDIRRWGGDARSPLSTTGPNARALPLLVLTRVIFLALPFSLHSSFVVLPFATLFCLSTALSASADNEYV